MEERICDKATENGFGFVDCSGLVAKIVEATKSQDGALSISQW